MQSADSTLGLGTAAVGIMNSGPRGPLSKVKSRRRYSSSSNPSIRMATMQLVSSHDIYN